jgi:CHASE3 domain sensor protein
MAQKLKVKDAPSLERDAASNAIINTDTSAYRSFKASRRRAKEQLKEIQRLHEDKSSMEQRLDDLEALVRKLSATIESPKTSSKGSE